MEQALAAITLLCILVLFTVPETSCLPRRMMNVTTFSPKYTNFTAELHGVNDWQNLSYRYMKIEGDKVFIGSNGYLFTQKVSDISIPALEPLKFENQEFSFIQLNGFGKWQIMDTYKYKDECRDNALEWRKSIKDFLCQNWVTEVYHFNNSSLFPNNDSYLICNTNGMQPYYKIYNITDGKFQDVYPDHIHYGTFNHGPRCQYNPAPYDFNLCSSFNVTDKSIYPHDDILTFCNTDLRSGHVGYSIASLGKPFMGRLPINFTNAPEGTTLKKGFSFRRTDYSINGVDGVLADHFLRTRPMAFDQYIFTFHEAIGRETIAPDREFFSVYPFASSVCTMDDGFSNNYMNGEKSAPFKTLASTRLVCRAQGFGDIVMNQVLDIKRFTDDTDMVYILFSTRTEEFNDVGVISGVCQFNLSKIIEIQETSIRRDFSRNGVPEQWGTSRLEWRRKRCTDIQPHWPGSNDEYSESVWIVNHRVTVENAYAEHNVALVTVYGTQYQFMVVDKQEDYNLFYFTTANGEIHKVLQYYKGIYDVGNRLTYSARSHVLQRWTPFLDTSYNYQIWYLEMALNGSYVYAANDRRVVQIKTDEHCHEYYGCAMCALDPHCGWNETCDCRNEECSCCEPYTAGLLQNIFDPLNGNVICKSCIFTDNHHLCLIRKHDVRYSYDDDYVNATTGAQSFFMLKAPKYIQCPRANESVWEKVENTGSVEYKLLGLDGNRHHINWNLDLIVTNVKPTDAGTYRLVCNTIKTKIVVRTYHVNVSGCSYSTANEYQENYNNWCKAFDEYKDEMSKWKEQKCENKCCQTP